MGIANKNLSFSFEDLLKMRLAGANPSSARRVSLPSSISQGLVLAESLSTVNAEQPESISLDQLDINQELEMAVEAPIAATVQSVILDPNSINPELEKIVSAEISNLESAEEKLSIDDKVTEKPKLTLGQVLATALPLFVPVPVPVGMIFNFLAQAGDDKKDTKSSKPETEGTGAEASSETGTEEKGQTSLWDTLSSGLSKMFEPFTKPLVAIWNNQIPQPVKDLFSKEKLMSLFSNKNNDVAQREKQLAQKLLQETTLGKQRVVETENKKRQIVSELIAREDRRRAEQARLDAIDEAARQAALAKANKDTLTALSDQQRKEAEKLQAKLIEVDSADKRPISESPKAKRAVASGLNLDFGKLSSHATEADLDALIKVAMIESPGAGLAYLYSMGKDLYALSNNTMFRSNDSANMTTVLTKYLNSGSDPTTAPKALINESLTQTGTTTLYNA